MAILAFLDFDLIPSGSRHLPVSRLGEAQNEADTAGKKKPLSWTSIENVLQVEEPQKKTSKEKTIKGDRHR